MLAPVRNRRAPSAHRRPHSPLADLRKLSPELGLPARLPDHQKISWWELSRGWKNSPVQRMLATFGELATNAAPPLPPLELLPDPAVDAAMEVLQANEYEVLWRQAQNQASDRQACAPHRLPGLTTGSRRRIIAENSNYAA